MPQSSAQQTALITGASSGIGFQLAHVFAQHGHNLFLVARSEARLAQLCAELKTHFGVEADFLAIDLSVPDSPDEVFAELKRRGIEIDILVNNAGFAARGEFARSDTDNTLGLLHLNIMSLTHLTRLLLPHMVDQHFGRILNVASIAAYMPGPLMAAYFASKAYVLSFSQALSNELAGAGVTVTAMCPGPTRTQFAARAGLCNTKAFKRKTMEAADVAIAGYNALMKGKSVVIPGWLNKLQLFPTPLVPRAVLAFFARQYNEDLSARAGEHTSEVPPAKPRLGVHSGS
jgi:short-subunit dehydrogenase